MPTYGRVYPTDGVELSQLIHFQLAMGSIRVDSLWGDPGELSHKES